MAKFATIDDYIDSLDSPLDDVARAARAVIDAGLPDATSAIKWGHPTWSVGKQPVCYLKRASAHLTFGFWRGASIHDPSGRLRSTGHVMAHTKLRTLADIDTDLFTDWLVQAHALEQPEVR